nr:MAG TPA: hypothetical protein [Microviridae sp.]
MCSKARRNAASPMCLMVVSRRALLEDVSPSAPLHSYRL